MLNGGCCDFVNNFGSKSFTGSTKSFNEIIDMKGISRCVDKL
jgi:hypothetical protein